MIQISAREYGNHALVTLTFVGHQSGNSILKGGAHHGSGSSILLARRTCMYSSSVRRIFACRRLKYNRLHIIYRYIRRFHIYIDETIIRHYNKFIFRVCPRMHELRFTY